MPGSKAHKFPHLTMLGLFDPLIKFRGETFEMVSSGHGHLRSFLNLRFISANQFSDINLCIYNSISF